MNNWEREAGCTEYDNAEQRIKKVAEYEGSLSRERHEDFLRGASTVPVYISSGPAEKLSTVRGMVGYGLLGVIPAVAFGWSVYPGPTYWGCLAYLSWTMLMAVMFSVIGLGKKNVDKKKLLGSAALIVVPFLLFLAKSYMFLGDFYYKAIMASLGQKVVMVLTVINVPLLFWFGKIYNAKKKS